MNTPLRKKIPTILGIFILLFGIASGVILLNAKQIFRLGAEGDSSPKNIKISNISDSGLTVSFVTDKESRSFVKVAKDKYFVNDVSVKRETQKSKTHYLTVDKLLPNTSYFVSINSDGVNYFLNNPWSVKTAISLPMDRSGINIYGKVYSKSAEPLRGAVVYLQCGNGGLLSTTTAEDGSWNVNIAQTRTPDGAGYLTIDENLTLIQILIQYDQMTSTITTYAGGNTTLPSIILGNNADLRNTPRSKSGSELTTPYVFGASTNSERNLFPIQNIYRERQVSTNEQ